MSEAPVTPALVVQHPAPEKIRDKLQWIDGLVQEYTQQLADLADAAKGYLAHGDDLTVVHSVLTVIKFKALELSNTVNCEAEEVGAHWVDDVEDHDAKQRSEISRRWNREPRHEE